MHTDPEDFGDDKSKLGAMRVVAQMARTILGTQVRVDEQALKRRQMDRMPEFLERLEKIRKALPTSVLAAE